MYALDAPHSQLDIFWITLFSHVKERERCYGFSVIKNKVVTSCEHDFSRLYGNKGMLRRVVEILPKDYRHFGPSRFVGTGEETIPGNQGLENVCRLNPEDFIDALDELADMMQL